MIGAPDNQTVYTILNDNKYFYSYLAGLWEGGGHITISSKQAFFCITFSKKEKPLVDYLVYRLGGWIREKENTLVWSVCKRSELVNLVNSLNGLLRTPKEKSFQNLIFFLNSKGYKIAIQPIDNSSLESNGWLAGFIDAAGCFGVRYTEKKLSTKERIALSFRLDQRKVYLNNIPFGPILSKIAFFLDIPLKETKRGYYRLELNSLKKLEKLINYLSDYPLLTSKKNNFDDWVLVYYMIKKGLTLQDKIKIKNIKRGMNKNRIHFNWNHLK